MEEFLNKIAEVTGAVSNWLWGVPLIVLIIATGIYLTVRTRWVQVLHLGKGLKYMLKDEESGKGEISSFEALCTALSATIGTGNIVGVATALCLGGSGALFWMIVAGFLGMATKYAEGVLAVKYRSIDSDGHVLGGPFYYIERGMGKKWKWLGVAFAVFGTLAGVMGIGTMTQVNGISSAAQNFFDSLTNISNYGAVTILGIETTWVTIIMGTLTAVCTALVLIGGIKRISKISSVIVPFMAVLYVLVCLTLVITNITKVPAAVSEIVSSAFNFKAVGGGMAGMGIVLAMRYGVARGIFSNESGLGSAPIAAAAARTNEPVRQGLVCMTGTFFDTIIICTLTGLSIVITGAHKVPGLEGVGITAEAFGSGLPFSTTVAQLLLMVSLVFFAFTTILGWDYYSERCLEYLTGGKKLPLTIFRWIYIAAVFIGPYLAVGAVFNIADIFNGLMALPNLIALVVLGGVVSRETKDYIARTKAEKKKSK